MLGTRFGVAVVLACLSLMAATSPARGDEVPLVTGEHWTKSSDQVKKAYLIGIANVLQIESAYQASSPPSDAQSLVPIAAVGLKGQTLDSVRTAVDTYYAAHPEDLGRPVFEVIWRDVVVPGRAKAALK